MITGVEIMTDTDNTEPPSRPTTAISNSVASRHAEETLATHPGARRRDDKDANPLTSVTLVRLNRTRPRYNPLFFRAFLEKLGSMRRLFPAALGFLKQLPVQLPQLLLALLPRALPLELFDLELAQGSFLKGICRRILRPALLLQHAQHQLILLLLPRLLVALQFAQRRILLCPCRPGERLPRKKPEHRP